MGLRLGLSRYCSVYPVFYSCHEVTGAPAMATLNSLGYWIRPIRER